MDADAAAAAPPTTLEAAAAAGYYITPTLPPAESDACRSIDDAVWALSTARPGNGIPQLLSDDVRGRLGARRAASHAAPRPRLRPRALRAPRPAPTPPPPQLNDFWQSDGTAPHIVSVQFRARTAVSEVAFFVNADLDESYTPRTVVVRAGALHHDLEEVRRVELAAPRGWVRIPLGAAGAPLRTWYLQVVVHAMKANGRDLHLRGLRVLGPGAAAAPGVHAAPPAPGGGGARGALLGALLGAGPDAGSFRDARLVGAIR